MGRPLWQVREIRELATRQGFEARWRQKSGDLTTAQNAKMIGCRDSWMRGRGERKGESGKQQVVGHLPVGRPQETACRHRREDESVGSRLGSQQKWHEMGLRACEWGEVEFVSTTRKTFWRAWRREGGQVGCGEAPTCSSLSLTGSFNRCVVGRS